MFRQLSIQTPLQRGLQHPTELTLLARQRLARIDLREDLIQRPRPPFLTAPRAPRSAKRTEG